MTGTIKKVRKYDARMKWDNMDSLASGSWVTNTGNSGVGVCPSGTGWTGYNLALDVAGVYLVTAHAIFASTSSDGFRGIRIYKGDSAVEAFMAAAGHYTYASFSKIIESNGNDTVRMGLYQNSGAAMPVNDIFITAIYLGEQ